VLVRFVYLVVCRLFALVLLLARDDRSKELELFVLRHELSILRRQARRPRLTCSAGTGGSSRAGGRTRTGGRAGRLSTRRYAS